MRFSIRADVTCIMKDAGYAHMGVGQATGKDKVIEKQYIATMLSKIGKNDLTSFKKHLEKNPDKLDEMVELAFDDQRTGANPVYPIMEDMKQLYIDAFNGNV